MKLVLAICKYIFIIFIIIVDFHTYPSVDFNLFDQSNLTQE